MYYDPSGKIALLTILAFTLGGIIIGVAIAGTVNDIYQLVNESDDSVYYEVEGDEVQIVNSYKIITPWVQYIYCLYLNYINKDTKDIIKGSSYGMQYEWALHNVAYAYFSIKGDEDKIKSSKSVDLGMTIFADNHNGENKILSDFMKISYFLMVNPVYSIYDLIIQGIYG